MRQPMPWIVGLLAGVAGGLMALAGLKAGTAAMLLLFAAPAVVYIATLGWGPVPGMIAAAVATLISGYDADATAFVAMGSLLFLPAAWAGNLANLGRPDESGRGMIWFPLSGILLRMMLALAAGFIVTGWLIGFSGDRIAALMTELLGEAIRANPDLAPADEVNIARSAELYAALLPLIMPAIWLMLHVLVFNTAAVITRQSGRLARPAEDIAAVITLPVAALAFPLAGFAGMMLLTGPLYDVAAMLAGIGLAGFGLLGLAELHLVSRGRPGRGLLLFAAYLVLILFSFPLVIFAAMGAGRVLRRRNAPPPPPARTGASGPSTLH